MGYKISDADKTTRQIAYDLQEVNDSQTVIIERQQQEITDLHNRLKEVSEDHSQQIDDIEGSFAMFSDQVETRIQNLPKAKANPVLPFVMIGGAAIALLVALGLNLEVQFGDSKISYKGEGAGGGVVSMILSFTGGGAAFSSVGSIKELFKQLKEK